VLPAGVSVKPIAWIGTIDALRKSIIRNTAFIGQAGIVKGYFCPNQTMCDYDTDWRPAYHYILRIAALIQSSPLWIREDKTARGWHIVICWNRFFTPLEIVALQLALGSDIQRETYNLARVMSGKKSRRWNLLFKEKL
jgi:hypothetical protein